MKRKSIIPIFTINDYDNYMQDYEKPFIAVSHVINGIAIEDFNIYFDHVEFARPTVFMEYCYNKNFPTYFKELLTLTSMAKSNFRDSQIFYSIINVIKNVLKKLPSYLREFDKESLNHVQSNYSQDDYELGTPSYIITSYCESEKIFTEPLGYLSLIIRNTNVPDTPINFVVYHNGDILFNQLSIEFSTKPGKFGQLDVLLDLSDVLRNYLCPWCISKLKSTNYKADELNSVLIKDVHAYLDKIVSIMR